MLTDFREKGREGEREREGNINVREEINWLPFVYALTKMEPSA